MRTVALVVTIAVALVSSEGALFRGLYSQDNPTSQTPITRGATEALLAKIPPKVAKESLIVSPDSRRLVYVLLEGNQQKAVVDGKEEKPYDGIGQGSLIFSRDGKRLAYAAREDSGFFFRSSKWFVVVDGKAGEKYDETAAVTFSPDGKRLAHTARIENKWIAVIDGKQGKPYDFVGELQAIPNPSFQQSGQLRPGMPLFLTVVVPKVVFSADGERVAYVAGDGGKWYAVVDEKEEGPYDSVVAGTLTFSPDGKQVAYAASARDPKTTADKFVMINGKKGKPYYGIQGRILFSADSQRMAYAADVIDLAVARYRQVAVVDGKEQGLYCVFRPKSAPNPLAKRHSFRLKSALVPTQIGTRFRVS